MSNIQQRINIPENEIQLKFIHSSGPGGQNVNKVATAVQLRFDITNSSSLSNEIKQQLLIIAKNKINENGILILESKEHRTQYQNRKSVLNKLYSLIEEASIIQKERLKTKPTQSSVKRRLDQKRRRGLVKKSREKISPRDIQND